MKGIARDTDCDFCAIAAGGSAEIVCQGDSWVAFFPLEPATPGHTLIIPRQHVADLWAIDQPTGEALMAAAVRVGRAIGRALSPEGMNLITSAGTAAEQTVFHLHLHLVPRWRRDGFGRIWPADGRFEEEDLASQAERVREECESDGAVGS